MIFSPPLYGRVLAGRKTETRRLVASGDLETKYRVGMRKAVQKGRGIHGEAHIILTDVRREPLWHITFEDARAEGFKTTLDFMAYWITMHDKAWCERQAELHPEVEFVELVSEIQARFEARWSAKWVWVLTFELDHSEHPRLLANRNARADYVESPALALSGSADPGEAVDARTQEKFSLEGIQGFLAREKHRELDRELLAAEDRMRLVRIEARAQGVDISQIEMVIRQRLREAERKIHRKRAA